MKVVSIDSAKEQKKKHRDEVCELLDQMKVMVEQGQLEEFVAASIGEDGDIRVHAVCKDFLGGLGLFEIGKNIFITQKDAE
jgi:hypothetical protein